MQDANNNLDKFKGIKRGSACWSARDDFNGGVSFETALGYLQNGFYAPVKELQTVGNFEQGSTIDFKASVCGVFASVPAYLSGDPLAFFEFNEQATNKKSFLIDVCVPANFDTEELKNKVELVLNIINSLECDNIKCEIIIGVKTVEITKQGKIKASHELEIVVKPFEDRINLGTHSFALGNIAFFRSLCLCYISLYAKDPRLGNVRPYECPEGAISVSLFRDSTETILKKML
jgi:hypothetical protein